MGQPRLPKKRNKLDEPVPDGEVGRLICTGLLNADMPHPLESYGILSIAIDPHYQGLGIGKMLMEHAEAIAREKGFCEMDLTVGPQNKRTIDFYE